MESSSEEQSREVVRAWGLPVVVDESLPTGYPWLLVSPYRVVGARCPNGGDEAPAFKPNKGDK